MPISSRAIATLAVCGLLSSSATLRAQEAAAPPLPIGEIAGGYAFVQHSDDNYHGWIFSGAANLSEWLGIVGEITGVYNTNKYQVPSLLTQNNRLYTYMAGPRFFATAGRVVPFGQFLAGGANESVSEEGASTYSRSDNYLAIQPGGGVTILISDHVGVRVGVDYRLLFMPSDSDMNEHDFRLTTGFTFGWGVR